MRRDEECYAGFAGEDSAGWQVADGLTDIGPSPLAADSTGSGSCERIGNILEGDYARRAPTAPIWLGAFALGWLG
jgi:hypothetical protein